MTNKKNYRKTYFMRGIIKICAYDLLPRKATVHMPIAGILPALPDTARSNINH